MPIDSSIYFQQQGGDLSGSLQRGLKMADLLDTRKLQQQKMKEDAAVKDIYKRNFVRGEDGSMSLNRNALMSELAGISPERAMAQQKDFQAQDVETRRRKSEELGMIAQLAGSAKDQLSYDDALKTAKGMGLDVSQLPSQYDANLVRSYQVRALTAKEQMDSQNQDIERADRIKARSDARAFEREKAQNDLDVELAKLGIVQDFQKGQQGRQFAHDKEMQGMKGDQAEKLKALAEAASGKKGFERLPEDKKLTITELAKKNASKTSIRNQIMSAMSGWDQLSDDMKVSKGRQLLKTLNSTEGADAIGAEEAKRLGSKLEFAMGNLFNSNPVQFGRDLEGFKSQALGTANDIGRAVGENQRVIDEAYGRTQAPQRESDVEQYAARHGISYDQALAVKRSRTSNVGQR